MKSRYFDECLIASSELIARTRGKLAQLQWSVDTCLTRIEVSADAIATSQALLAKLAGGAADTMDPPHLRPEQTSEASAATAPGAPNS